MPTPRLPLRLAVEGTKLAVAAAFAVIAVAPAVAQTAAPSADQGGTRASAAETGLQAEATRLMSEHDCSTSGFGPGVVPGSALVRHGAHIEHVSFEDGWAVYSGDQRGTLVAVCRVAI